MVHDPAVYDLDPGSQFVCESKPVGLSHGVQLFQNRWWRQVVMSQSDIERDPGKSFDASIGIHEIEVTEDSILMLALQACASGVRRVYLVNPVSVLGKALDFHAASALTHLLARKAGEPSACNRWSPS
jgi:hypothetical protein